MKPKPNQLPVGMTTRRKLLAAGIVGTATSFPAMWSKPVVETVLLPAHAQATLTGCSGEYTTTISGNCVDGLMIAFTLGGATVSASFENKGRTFTGTGALATDGSFSFLINEPGGPGDGFSAVRASGTVTEDCGQITGTVEDDDPTDGAGFCSGSSSFTAVPG